MLAVGAALALGGCARREEPVRERVRTGPSVAERVRVLNADVFVVDGQHIRLAEAYAPQPIPDARCWAEALAAKQATIEVRGLMSEADSIELAPTGRRDEYNRIVAKVSLGGVDLARTLYDLGLAAQKAEGRFGWCEPISKGEAGAPPLRAMMDFGR